MSGLRTSDEKTTVFITKYINKYITLGKSQFVVQHYCVQNVIVINMSNVDSFFSYLYKQMVSRCIGNK